MLEFRILGPLEVVTGKGSARLGGLKPRATLAILLLDANRVVSVERLADDLYAGAPPVTAVTQVQRQISELRKAIGSPAVIETRAPGYVIRLAPEQLDLNRFERAAAASAEALERGDAESAAALAHQALALWRGAPLADLAYEPFAQLAIGRLEEIRLAAIELRIDADLALGRHATLVGELETLVWDHPLRERLRAQLMIALYRSGRQPDALDAYRRARDALVHGFGIEPSAALHELQAAILVQDPSLDLSRGAQAARRPDAKRDRSVLVLPSRDEGAKKLLTIAEPLARPVGGELIVARLLPEDGDVSAAASALSSTRTGLDLAARTAAFTTVDAARDAVRLATTYGVELVLLDAPPELDGPLLPPDLVVLVERSPADVAVHAGARVDWGRGSGIALPFGGSEHDWAALEVGAWLASATGAPLRLVGTKADQGRGRRDASRLLADASLAVQRVAGVEAEPLLAEPTEEGLVVAVEGSTLAVAGITQRWRVDGIGATRRALLQADVSPLVIVHRGPRPGGLAPGESRTRFTWSIEG